ncbi:unnamed protein product [Acanthoscelides obtectus]|uniref:Uncharacterized protein n=1 Tax=Acanthoscelides obtectus TaxID=200917 RepID=A0A9P0MBC5_ACAOB|nr:unnamed protein product [Acanthoscelides obtectus]CAK1688277.1 hypothetical protein AOBTE_LOCUS36665 [Acanthoscelides obtectus]
MIVNYFYILQIISPSLKCIIHKFLPRGHTHMEADHIHALIERVIKKQPTMKIVFEMQTSRTSRPYIPAQDHLSFKRNRQ